MVNEATPKIKKQLPLLLTLFFKLCPGVYSRLVFIHIYEAMQLRTDSQCRKLTMCRHDYIRDPVERDLPTAVKFVSLVLLGKVELTDQILIVDMYKLAL